MENKKIVRESNFELMRIICMLMIIGAHYAQRACRNDWDIMLAPISVNKVFTTIFGSWGQLGVCGFIAISCYFLTKKDGFKLKKCLLLIFETFFYCCIYIVIGLTLNVDGFSKKHIILELITPLYGQYWFITTYIVFFTITPFLHIFMDNLTDKQLKVLLITTTLFIPIYNFIKTNVGGQLSNFIYIYIAFSYLNRKENNFFEKNRKKGFILLTIFITLLSLSITLVGTRMNSTKIIKQIVTKLNTDNLFMMVDAVFMFYVFKHTKIGKKPIINSFGKSTLGVYLIHDNMVMKGLENQEIINGERSYKNSLLWNNILHSDKYYMTIYFPIHMFLSIIIVFIISSIVDIIRINTLEKIVLRSSTLDKLCNKFDNWYYSK